MANIELPPEIKALLLDPSVIPHEVYVRDRRYVVDRPITTGCKSAVWRVIDDIGRARALKLAMEDDYQDRSYLQEVVYLAKLDAYPQFAGFVEAGMVEVVLGSERLKFVGFVEEWVEGHTLEAFLVERREEVTVSFLRSFVQCACEVLQSLHDNGLCHDDLHSRNVMIAPVKGALETTYALKVIDMGSMKPTGTSTKPIDDLRHLVNHIVAICNAIHFRRVTSTTERRFLRAVVGLLGSMLDVDPDTSLRDPKQIREQFDMAFTRASQEPGDRPLALTSPFEFLSAEHIADDRLLVQIFAKSCPWLDKVSGPDPCLVTGPRGCGKSTIFRWLSLKAHLRQPSAEFESLRIAGFYISCNTDLQNRLGWITTEPLARRFRGEIIHYFNLLAAREIVHTLSLVAIRPDRESYWGLGAAQERAVYEWLCRALEGRSHFRVQGVPLLLQMQELIEAEMQNTHLQMLRGLNLSSTTPDTFLGDLTSLLVKEIAFFARKRPTFLVDDFSVHRLSKHVQVILNRVIWERRPSHVFKLSSEKYGAVLTDSFNATADPTREMLEIDCGREFIALDDFGQGRRALAFAIELLDNRLKQAGYSGTAESLIGRSQWDEGSLGVALANPKKGRLDDEYHGLECIAQLCSGDVSSLLLVFSSIFDAGKVKNGSTTQLSKTVQSRAIREASRKKLEAIKPSFPYGPAMYGVVDAFGNLVRNVLQRGAKLRKGNQPVPSQCPRIEIDQGAGAVSDSLTPEQRELALELIRRAVFIEMEPGLSRHGNVTTLRWHLRRIYLPAFGAALAKNDAIKGDPDWFKFFLLNPKAACDNVWARRKRGNDGQGNLELEYGQS